MPIESVPIRLVAHIIIDLPMSKLTALRKQIAALEAQAERIAKVEMTSAIAKVKAIMSEFNLSIEHLTQGVGSKRIAAKAKTASVAKYADPKTGKTWSGFGRAPGWIAGSKNRDAFLVGTSPVGNAAVKASASSKTGTAKAKKVTQPAKRAAKPVPKKARAVVKKASNARAATSATVKKRPIAKKAPAKKSAPRKAALKAGAPSPAEVAAATKA